jgi:membrane-associated protease RseP (regulator of RpoE activity)
LSNEISAGHSFPDSRDERPAFPSVPLQPSRVPESAATIADAFVYQPRQRFQHVWWKHILLLLLTIGTTTLVGGAWYSATILAILGAHEMGHYLACRYYRVDATLPYFLPMFIPLAGPQTGTLGAVIRIREPFQNRRVLFDVGIAGPIAGFAVLVPAIFVGMALSTVVEAFPVPYQLGRPLLYQFARWMTFGAIPDTHFVSLHPMVFGAWFGMLATALNLLPFGQLDGGHITYAVLGRRATPISFATVASALVMTFFSLSWVVMTALMLVMLLVIGPKHPPVLDETEPLGVGRRALAIFALIMFILCFMPVPIRLF